LSVNHFVHDLFAHNHKDSRDELQDPAPRPFFRNLPIRSAQEFP
jgi:hypothetical protein